MRFKENGTLMRSIRAGIQPLWNSRIQDLTALQQSHSESVLVALDTESLSRVTKGNPKPCQDVSEVGIAILPLNGQIPQLYGGIKQLHYEDGAEAFTIQIRERRALPKEKPIGQVIRSTPKDVASIIESILSKYKGHRILVGFDLHNEFKWIAEECPTISPYFTAWLDVQEFALQRRKEFAAEPAKLTPPGLSDVLNAMDVPDERRFHGTHYAVNDALRSLIVLCGLASDPSLLSDLCSKPATRNSVQCYSQLKLKQERDHHQLMARVSAFNGGKLPPLAPHAVSRHFAAHADLKAVGLNWRKEKDKSEGVRFWQLLFRTAESLEGFIAEINGSTLNGTKLLVAKFNFQQSLKQGTDGLMEETTKELVFNKSAQLSSATFTALE